MKPSELKAAMRKLGIETAAELGHVLGIKRATAAEMLRGTRFVSGQSERTIKLLLDVAEDGGDGQIHLLRNRRLRPPDKARAPALLGLRRRAEHRSDQREEPVMSEDRVPYGDNGDVKAWAKAIAAERLAAVEADALAQAEAEAEAAARAEADAEELARLTEERDGLADVKLSANARLNAAIAELVEANNEHRRAAFALQRADGRVVSAGGESRYPRFVPIEMKAEGLRNGVYREGLIDFACTREVYNVFPPAPERNIMTDLMAASTLRTLAGGKPEEPIKPFDTEE